MSNGPALPVVFPRCDVAKACIIAKRLARGRFHLPLPASPDARHLEVDAAELGLLLEGIDLSDAQRRKRFRLLPRPPRTA